MLWSIAPSYKDQGKTQKVLGEQNQRKHEENGIYYLG
jgi:hypothetical protein